MGRALGALRQTRGWDGYQVWLWASQVEPARHHSTGAAGDPQLPHRIGVALQALVAQRPSLQLVLRPHPSETDYPLVPGERQWLSSPEEPLAELLHACDGVVVLTSTVGLEARLAGCRVVQVTGSLYTPDAPYLTYGIADAAVPLDGLAAALDAAPVQAAAHLPAEPALPRVLQALEPWL